MSVTRSLDGRFPSNFLTATVQTFADVWPGSFMSAGGKEWVREDEWVGLGEWTGVASLTLLCCVLAERINIFASCCYCGCADYLIVRPATDMHCSNGSQSGRLYTFHHHRCFVMSDPSLQPPPSHTARLLIEGMGLESVGWLCVGLHAMCIWLIWTECWRHAPTDQWFPCLTASAPDWPTVYTRLPRFDRRSRGSNEKFSYRRDSARCAWCWF